jgi:hypothetical protein
MGIIAARVDLRPPIYKWLQSRTADFPNSPPRLSILARDLLYQKLQHILAVPLAWGHVISLGRNDAGAVLDLLQEVSVCASD